MTRINTNVSSLIGLHNLQKSQGNLSTSLQRLSTGLQINSGADNPSGLIASEGLKLQITTINQSIENSNRANNVLATADSALGQISGLLNQIRGLVQSGLNTGALSSSEITANQQQIDQALSAINQISSNTTFGGLKLIDGSLGFQTATTAADAAKLSDYQVNEALFGTNSTVAINATVTTAAQQGELRYNGGSLTSATTLEVGGSKGSQVVFLGSASTVSDVKNAINSVSDATGVDATLRAGLTVGGGTAGAATASTLTYTTKNAVTAAAASKTFNSNGSGVLTVTANSTGTAGNSIDVTFVVAGNNTALSATESTPGHITVNLATDGGGAVVDASNTADLIASAINGISGVSVTAAGNSQAGGYVAAAASTLTGGVDAAAAETITFTAATAGFAGNNINVVVNTGGSNAVSSSTSAGVTTLTITKTATDTAATLAAYINGNSTANALVSATNSGTSTIANTLASTALSGGVDGNGGAVKFTDARAEGSSGTISVIFANPGSNNAALGISTSAADSNGNRTITVNLATNGSGAITSTAAQIVSAIQGDATASTLVNVSATTAGVVSAAASGNLTQGVDAELVLKSHNYGSAEFVNLNVLSGTFATTLNDETTASYHDDGTDIQANINGQVAHGSGLTASVKTGTLDAALSFNTTNNVANTTANVTVTGGGSVFQIGQQVDSSGQIGLGIDAVNTARLGGISGKLYELSTGGGKSLLDVGPNVSGSTIVDIINQALEKVNTLRGRIGAIQTNVIDTNVTSLGVALENISAAKSLITDTDFATETANMQKAQVLSQAGISVLTIANQVPQQVLSLLR